jgi:hypothetical protein
MHLIKVATDSWATVAEDPDTGRPTYIGVFSTEELHQSDECMNGLRVKHEGGDRYHKNLRKDKNEGSLL